MEDVPVRSPRRPVPHKLELDTCVVAFFVWTNITMVTPPPPTSSMLAAASRGLAVFATGCVLGRKCSSVDTVEDDHRHTSEAESRTLGDRKVSQDEVAWKKDRRRPITDGSSSQPFRYRWGTNLLPLARQLAAWSSDTQIPRTGCEDFVVKHQQYSKSLENESSSLHRSDTTHAKPDKEVEETKEEARVVDEGSVHEQHCDEGDVYPNFSRHGKDALLPRYLTTDVFEKLRWKQTPSGVTIEDIIRSGVALPGGSRPPRGLAGVYAGDSESYYVFGELFAPLIQDYHQSQQQATETRGLWQQLRRKTGKLQRHQTNLNYNHLLQDTLDPEGEYILYTRMRLARSISGFRFSPCIRRGERRQVETLLRECVQSWPGKYVSVMEMTNSQHDNLIQQHILFNDPDDFLLTAGFGRDWPDARGIYCDTWQDTPAIIIWCNAEDHLWVISHGKGGNVQGVFTKLSQAVNALEEALKERDRRFVEDRKYGFLNASPVNIGTALRASVYVKLVRLSRQPGFFELIHRLRLEARSEYSQTDRRFTGIYDIANAEALGKSEVDLINIMIRGVGFLIDLEKRLERGEIVDLATLEV